MKVSIIIPYLRESVYRTIELCYLNHGIEAVQIIAEKDIPDIDGKMAGCPNMVSLLTKKASFDLICFLGDDTLPQKDFLKYACQDMLKLKDGVGLVGLNDKTGRFLPTHWLAHKELLSILDGEFFHTGYHHCCCDVELMERCIEQGKYIFSRDSVVLHDHPFIVQKKSDEHYERAYSKQTQDRELLFKRRLNRWK